MKARHTALWSFACGALAVLGLTLPAASQANVPVYSVSAVTTTPQAGAHPDIKLEIHLAARGSDGVSTTVPCFCNTIKELVVNTPAGLIANPSNLPQCTAAELSTLSCPTDSQVGILLVGLFSSLAPSYQFVPIYNMEARADQLALLGSSAPNAGSPIYISISSRTEGDYGLEFKTFGIPGLITPVELTQFFWGVPADPVHDGVRWPFSPGKIKQGNCGLLGGTFNPKPDLAANIFPEECYAAATNLPPTPANSSLTPFTQNPTACLGTPLTMAVDSLAYDLGTSHGETQYPATTGCDTLSFAPSLSAKPTTSEADSPSGLDVDLTVPQNVSPENPTASAIRELSVTLPAGMTVNPNAANGKTACTDAEAKFGTRDQAQCPEYSKIGTSETISNQFPAALPGAMYIGQPLPDNRYRIFLTADGFGLHVKLPGTLTLDPVTGQATTTFKDLPQFNFQEFKLHFFGAERGLLATPEHCGTYQVDSQFTPWAYPSIPKQTSTQFFTIDSGPGGSDCPPATRPFNPSFSGGVADNTAGAHSTFSVDLSRPDGDQNLTGLNVTTPPGFSASLKGIPYCSEAAIDQLDNSLYTGLQELASSSCPADSQVGTVIAGAGAGSKPLYVNGKAYLAGPYKSSPLSLEVVIPAVSGPYDLGNVAVRVALNVDPITAQVSAVSDPLPHILEGIPLRTRIVRVSLDRKDFALNPTNCDPLSIDATASGDQGGAASLSTHFQVANCAVLGFGPKLSIQLRGHATKRNGHPALHAVFRPRSGDANAKRVVVALPPTMQLDSTHIGTVCTRAQFDANQCPARSIIGTATAQSPLIDQPLKGTVYLVSAGNRLPDLVMALRGQFSIDLHGVIDSAPNGGLRNSFKVVPDVPVTSFTLDLQGGRKGLIVYNTDVCAHPKTATAQIDGQNGRSANQKVALHPACAKARHKRSHHKRHKRHKRHHARRAGR